MSEALISAVAVTVVSTITVGVVLDKSKRKEFGSFVVDVGHGFSKLARAIYEFFDKITS